MQMQDIATDIYEPTGKTRSGAYVWITGCFFCHAKPFQKQLNAMIFSIFAAKREAPYL
jgi:hypothetical protein